MPQHRPIAASITLLIAAACSSTGDAPEAPESILPTPYTAAEIEAANPPGAQRVYLISAAGKPPVLQTTRFLPDEEGLARFEATVTDLAGSPLEGGKEGRATWEELRSHAAFPAAETTRHRTSCVVAAGIFSCWLYERTEPAAAPESAAMVHRFWFADRRAGQPVLYELSRGGDLVYRMELVKLADRAP